jgi:hypothetical protein
MAAPREANRRYAVRPSSLEELVKRLLATAPILVLALSLSACAAATGSPLASQSVPAHLSGLDKTRIEHSAHSGTLNGVWSLRLRNGTYTFKYTGRIAKNVIISGLYVTDRHTITLKDRTGACSSKRPGGCGFLSCPRPGRYSFKLIDQILTFTKLQDANPNCERPVVLAGKFRRVR